MAAAAASFNTCMLSISFGLILSNGLPVEKLPLAVLLELTDRGNPSITYKGSLPPLIDPEPRI
jgi:hypothetical protein